MHVGEAAAIRKTHLAAGIVLLASLLASAPAAAQGRGARPAVTLDRPDIIFQNYCSVCHGERGDGQSLARHALNPPPVDFTAEDTRKRLSRAHMIEVLTKGSRTKEGKTTAMVSWKAQLSRPQIEAVVDYVIVNFMAGKVASSDQVHAQGHEHEGHDHSKANVKEVDYPYGLKANAARGKSIYAANCVNCHGAKGDGRGKSPLIGVIKPRNFHDPDFREFGSGFSIYSAVSRGKGHMPAWDKNLSNQEIADVSEYVLRTFAKPRRTAHAH